MKKTDELIITKEPSKLRNIAVGSSEDEIIIIFNREDEENAEYACVFPPEQLKDIIITLFKCGIEYEKTYNKNVGFIKRGDEE